MERKCKNCSTHDDFTGACFNGNSEHRADFTSGEFVCQCHSWDSNTIKQAFSIVREAILADEDICKCVTRIDNILKNEPDYISEYKAAELVLQRIVGAEE